MLDLLAYLGTALLVVTLVLTAVSSFRDEDWSTTFDAWADRLKTLIRHLNPRT